jgi:hypothetical protein
MNSPNTFPRNNENVSTLLIGIDCATEDTRVGIALGEYSAGAVKVIHAKVCARERSAAASVAERLRELVSPALLAIDAPLGWQQSISRVLAAHRAGDKIATAPNDMFRRATASSRRNSEKLHSTSGRIESHARLMRLCLCSTSCENV